MSIKESFKNTFNIGGTEIKIVTRNEIYHQFDKIEGDVIITGKEYEQRGNSVTLELKEFWTEARSTGQATTIVTVYKTHQKVILENEFIFMPGIERGYNFDVHLPENCRISTKSTGWQLAVTLDIPKAVDPSGRWTLNVQPAKEMLSVVEACEKNLQFHEKTGSRRWNKKTTRTYFKLLPSKEMSKELDYMAFELLQSEEGGVHGEIIFNMQEKSLIDYVKAILKKDRVRKPVQFKQDQVMLSGGKSNLKKITQIISQLLESVVFERGMH